LFRSELSMLDLNFVRSNFEVVKQKLEQRGFPLQALNRFAELDERRRPLVGARDDMNAERNRESQEIGKLIKAGNKEAAESRRAEVRSLGDKIAAAEVELAKVESDLNALMVTIPNLPDSSVPVGADESANLEVRKWGEPPRFEFEPMDHVELGTRLGILNLEDAAKISGARFSILTGSGARPAPPPTTFCLALHTTRAGHAEIT